MRVDGRILLIRYVWTGIRKEKVADSKIYGCVLKEPQLIVIVQDVNRIFKSIVNTVLVEMLGSNEIPVDS